MYVPPVYHWPPKGLWREKPLFGQQWREFAAYFHFPFCRNICEFCGYETRLFSKGYATGFIERSLNQIHSHAASSDFANSQLRAVFLGGGTASLMTDQAVSQVLVALRQLSAVSEDAEITLECEPGTVNRERLRKLRDLGVNRISVATQSFDDSVLSTIGRRHTSQEAIELISDCVDVGIMNIHVDLMYGLPNQSISQWVQSVKLACNLPITHLSAYKLYVFKHGAWDRNGIAPRPDQEGEAYTAHLREYCETARSILIACGFEQYTLTEFALPGRQSEYIRFCFDRADILPIGPGAFGRCGFDIWENQPYVSNFESSNTDGPRGRAFRMTPLDAFKRDVILGLWLLKVSLPDLARWYSVRISEKLIALVEQLDVEDLIEFSGKFIEVAGRHRFGIGEVMSRLGKFETAEWGTVENLPRQQDSIGEPSSTLAILIRMARRDPAFFHLLSTSPESTLQTIGYDIDTPDIHALIQVISKAEGADRELCNVWQAVEKENMAVRRTLTSPGTGEKPPLSGG